MNKEPSEVVQVSAEDLEEAGRSIIHAAQSKAFQGEFKLPAREAEEQGSFPKQKTAKLRSSINKLDLSSMNTEYDEYALVAASSMQISQTR